MTRWLQLVLSLALLVGACTSPAADPDVNIADSDGPSPASSEAGEGLEPDDIVLASSLQPFSACDDLLAYFKREARKLVGPYGLSGQDGGHTIFSRRGGVAVDFASGPVSAGASGSAGGAMAPVPAAPAAPAAPAEAPAPVEGTDFSGTNVQEAGVDEPDIVKTDGRIVVTAMDRRLRIVDLDRPEQVAGTLRLKGWDHELLLQGDRVLVLTRADPWQRFVPVDIRRPGVPNIWGHGISVLTVVDISDPSDPRVDTQLTLDGTYRSARMTDGVARVVLSSDPVALPFTYPRAGGLRARRSAAAANRKVIEDSQIEDWLPYYVAQRPASADETTEGTLVPCDGLSRPRRFSGLGTVSVLSVDLAGDLAPRGVTGVVASGESVYASPGTLYVTTNRWMDPGRRGAVEDYSTEIHAFDISDPGPAVYEASGSVRGHVLNQFSMSEHDGHLRVATTDGTPLAAERNPNRSESFVTVLEPRDGVLHEVGQVGDLGRGERIYAVRFLGDTGYVVTFRETDPLYTVDLSDPTAPRTTGELKIRGYSAYLHPVGDGLLLGVGQDATRRGRTLGTQISLFDVSDPRAPRRVARNTLADSSSEAEWDHHAFVYWAPEDLAVIPFESHRFERGRDLSSAGVRAFTVRARGIEAAGTVGHPEIQRSWQPPIRRSMVVGEDLITVSHAGLMVSDLQTFEQDAFARFDR